MDKKWFTPKKDHGPICPHTKAPVPALGKWVAASDEFYIRRVLDGDGTLTDDMSDEAKAEEARLEAEGKKAAEDAKKAREEAGRPAEESAGADSDARHAE
jgi:uncharacterized protein YjbJ (UPF0337 family)